MLYVLVSLFVVIILGFGIIGYIIYKNGQTAPPRIQNNNEILGFDNPVYNHDYQNRNVEDNNYANYPPPPGQIKMCYIRIRRDINQMQIIWKFRNEKK